MRTQDEIAEYYEKCKDKDLLGFKGEVLLSYMDFAHAKCFLKETATEEEWITPTQLTREAILGEMKEYMEFAWGKVKNHRGISASRSVEKMEIWLWLLGDEDLIRTVAYAQYGAPVLEVICQNYGFLVPESDEIRRMADGLPCCEGCEEGCG